MSYAQTSDGGYCVAFGVLCHNNLAVQCAGGDRHDVSANFQTGHAPFRCLFIRCEDQYGSFDP